MYVICCNIAGCLSTICIDLLTLWFKQIYKCVEYWIWKHIIIMQFICIQTHIRAHHSYSYSVSFFFALSLTVFAIARLALKHCKSYRFHCTIVPFKIHSDAFLLINCIFFHLVFLFQFLIEFSPISSLHLMVPFISIENPLELRKFN